MQIAYDKLIVKIMRTTEDKWKRAVHDISKRSIEFLEDIVIQMKYFINNHNYMDRNIVHHLAKNEFVNPMELWLLADVDFGIKDNRLNGSFYTWPRLPYSWLAFLRAIVSFFLLFLTGVQQPVTGT